MRKLVFAGIVLIMVSVYPLVLMAIESALGNYAYKRYRVVPEYETSTVFHGHRVAVVDQAPRTGSTKPSSTFQPIQILIDGRSCGLDSPVGIQTHYTDGSRYNGWVSLIRLVDNEQKTERMAIIQRLGPEDIWPRNEEQMRFRVLFLSPSGDIEEESFDFAHRASPVYRTMLAKFAAPMPIGFRSQVLEVWPTLVYPILYPFVSSLVGLALLLVASVTWLNRRARSAM